MNTEIEIAPIHRNGHEYVCEYHLPSIVWSRGFKPENCDWSTLPYGFRATRKFNSLRVTHNAVPQADLAAWKSFQYLLKDYVLQQTGLPITYFDVNEENSVASSLYGTLRVGIPLFIIVVLLTCWALTR